MSPEISEFSYGFALVDELIHGRGLPINAVPIYPSLIEEARLGYDVALQHGGVPLFLQFKLAHYMVRKSTIEVRKNKLTTPFYRMYLRPLKYSNQHRLLLDLERQGNAVFYAAPSFHLPNELNDAYTQREMVNRSRFFRPSVIGDLPDDGPHHVSFKPRTPGFVFCSEPESRSGDLPGEGFDAVLQGLVRRRAKTALTPRALDALWNQMLSILADNTDLLASTADMDEVANPLGHIAHLAHTYFGCDMVVIQEREQRNRK